MSVTRKEMIGFKQIVCNWLRKQGINITKLSIESHTGVDGYVIFWNDNNQEYVIYNKDEWEKYIDLCGYKKIRKVDLRKLRIK